MSKRTIIQFQIASNCISLQKVWHADANANAIWSVSSRWEWWEWSLVEVALCAHDRLTCHEGQSAQILAPPLSGEMFAWGKKRRNNIQTIGCVLKREKNSDIVEVNILCVMLHGTTITENMRHLWYVSVSLCHWFRDVLQSWIGQGFLARNGSVWFSTSVLWCSLLVVELCD